MKKRTWYNFEANGIRTRSGELLYEIREDDKIGYISVHEFINNVNATLAGLVQYGIVVTPAKRAQIINLINDIDDFEDSPLFSGVGFNGRQFVYPDGDVFSPDGAPSAGVIFQTRPEKCHQAGDLEGWLGSVAAPLAGHVVCEFALSIPFAGPLRSQSSRVENHGWELAGPKGCGKSVLLQLLGSACGGTLGGDEGNFNLTFRTTDAGVESQMKYYSDLIMIIDEANLFELASSSIARARAMSQFLMALGKGSEKTRYGADAKSYRFVYITSANEMITDVLRSSSAEAVAEAVADRLMTIPLFARPYGIFDHLPAGYADVGDQIADLVNASSLHHGVVMRHYLACLVNLIDNDREMFRSRLEWHISTFREHACVQANAGSARRVADAFGLVYAAGHLAKHLGCLPRTYNPLRSTLACYRMHRSIFQSGPSAAERLLALAESSDVMHLDSNELPHISDKKLSKLNGFVRRNNRGTKELLISPASIRRLIPDWNRVRRDDFEVAKLIVRDGERHTVKRQIRSNNGPERVICIDLSRLSDRT